jgi:hypothetical protein
MNILKKLFGNGSDAEDEKPNGKGKSPLDKKPKKKTDSSMFCNPEEQARRDAEVEAVKKKSEESHRDLSETIAEFNVPEPKKERLETPKA